MVTAAERFRSRLREWRDSGSEIQITSKRSFHAKYIWLMCARPPGDTVDREQRGEAFINRRAARSSVADEKRRDLRSTVMPPLVWTSPSGASRHLPINGEDKTPTNREEEVRTCGWQLIRSEDEITTIAPTVAFVHH